MILSKISAIYDAILCSIQIAVAQKSKKLIKRNLELKGQYSGRIFIFYTGSSINSHNISLLKNEYSMGVNTFFLHPDYSDLNVDFFAFPTNWNYFKLYILSWFVDICFSKSKKGMISFFNTSASFYLKNKPQIEYRDVEKKWPKKGDIYYVYSSGKFDTLGSVNGNIDQPCNILNGSLYFSISLAVYLGFTEVYLMGADYTIEPFCSGHFYDGMHTCKDKSKPNDNHPEYLGAYKVMRNKQSVINEYAKSLNVSIFNVVEKGCTSKVFNPVNYEDIEGLISE